MVMDSSGYHSWRYWQPDLTKKIRYETDEEYAEVFFSLLEESVRCRMRSVTQVGVLMSGGLDSTSVASIAARMIKPKQLNTFSYVFNELSDCDERQYIDAVKEEWSLRSIQIPCDDLWPYKNWSSWPHNPNHPIGNPYRLLKERAYQRVHKEGMRVLLTGGFGDHLYDGADDWLADILAEGQLWKAIKELVFNARYFGLSHILKARSSRRVLRRILDRFFNGWHSPRSLAPYPWLTDFSNKNIYNVRLNNNPVLEQKANLLGLRAAQSGSSEIFNASRHTLDLRHPYRDRRLVEFVLALPAYQLYSRGRYKHILRMALKALLPEKVRNQRKPTSLLPLFSRGIEREYSFLESHIQNVNANWHRFVNQNWLFQNWSVLRKSNNDGPKILVPWLCVSYQTWYKTLFS